MKMVLMLQLLYSAHVYFHNTEHETKLSVLDSSGSLHFETNKGVTVFIINKLCIIFHDL